MAMDLQFCIYLANNGASKSKKAAEPPKVIYDSFLQGLSNDIERYQALQRVICGHAACKEAMLKSMQAAK